MAEEQKTCLLCNEPLDLEKPHFVKTLEGEVRRICVKCAHELEADGVSVRLNNWAYAKRERTDECFMCGVELEGEWPLVPIDGADIQVPMCWDCADTMSIASPKWKRDAATQLMLEKLRRRGALPEVW